jgi:hypothetical protein
VAFVDGATAKAVIEDAGVPHTEVDLLLVNGVSVGFDYRVRDADRMSIYPVFESWDIGPVSLVRPSPLRESRFALDVHLGKLARMLRMFGFDVAYDASFDDEALARAAREERRIVLSRDRGLLKRRMVTHGYLVRSLAPREQLSEVVRRFDLASQARLFSRCMLCNATLLPVDREIVLPLLPAVVAETCTRFSRCPACGRVFWRGTHWERMKQLAAEVLQPRPAGEQA